jgi:hypothetical protein
MIDTLSNTEAVKPDIIDSLEVLYRDIILLLDHIIQSMLEVPQ